MTVPGLGRHNPNTRADQTVHQRHHRTLTATATFLHHLRHNHPHHAPGTTGTIAQQLRQLAHELETDPVTGNPNWWADNPTARAWGEVAWRLLETAQAAAVDMRGGMLPDDFDRLPTTRDGAAGGETEAA